MGFRRLLLAYSQSWLGLRAFKAVDQLFSRILFPNGWGPISFLSLPSRLRQFRIYFAFVELARCFMFYDTVCAIRFEAMIKAFFTFDRLG